MTKMAVIDIDGVIADSNARFALATTNGRVNWNVAFDPRNVPLDTLIAGVAEAIDQLEQEGYKIFYLTSRPKTMRDATLKWLKQYGLSNGTRPMIFKPLDKQYTKTKVWKVEEVQGLVNFYQVTDLLFVDDEPANCEELLANLTAPDTTIRVYASLALALEKEERHK